MSNKIETIQLSSPVEYKGKIYSTLFLTEFKAKHFKYLPEEIFELADNYGEGSGNNPENIPKGLVIKIASKMIPLIAAMANVDAELIGELSINDLINVVTKMFPLLAGSLSGGDQ